MYLHLPVENKRYMCLKTVALEFVSADFYESGTKDAEGAHWHSDSAIGQGGEMTQQIALPNHFCF